MPWLTEKSEKLGYQTLCPDFPHTDQPTIEEWVSFLSRIVGKPDANSYFVGHSIGCQTILRYLETIDTPIGGTIFVAGWFNLENMADAEEERIARPWLKTPIDVSKIKSVLPKSTLIISTNDPCGAFEENKAKFTELGTKIVVVPNAGHLTAEDGYQQIPVVIDELQNFLMPGNLKNRLKEEGFANVFDWHDNPGTKYAEHAHRGKVSFYVLRGAVTFSGDIEITVSAGERFDVPMGIKHSAIVGSDGCDWVVGEEIKGDS